MDRRDGSAPDRRRRALLAAACGLGAVVSARAQNTARTLRICCAAPPGGTPDIIARQYAARLDDAMPWHVENRPGAGGLVAVAALQQSHPDGATMLLGHSGLATMYPYLYARLPYDPAADLVSVSPAAETAFGFAVGPLVPARVRSVADYAGWAREHADQATCGSAGVATLTHVLGVMVARELKFDTLHVPYLGGPPALADLVGGRIASLVLPVGLLRSLHEGGQLRVLATSGTARSAVLPAVPTVAEEGHPGLAVQEWFGFFMPRGTPKPVVDAAAAAVRAAAAKPELVAALDDAGLLTLSGTPASMDERIEREKRQWREVIAATGIRAGS